MSDEKEKKKALDPPGRLTARDVLVFAAGEEHWHCTVIAKGRVKKGVGKGKDTVAFKCLCGNTYIVAATADHKAALRNIPEDKKLDGKV